jgi:hypothetical protein
LLRSWHSVQIDGVLERDPVSFKSHHLLNTQFLYAGMPRSSSIVVGPPLAGRIGARRRSRGNKTGGKHKD